MTRRISYNGGYGSDRPGVSAKKHDFRQMKESPPKTLLLR